MKIGFIGLGRMGYNMVLRLVAAKKEVIVYNRHPEKVKDIAGKGAKGAYSYAELFKKLGPQPRIVWIMVSHEAVDEIISGIRPFLKKGDIVIDGGNSNHNLSKLRAQKLASAGINFMDAGVSGGLIAAKVGYCVMIGGTKEAYKKTEPFIKAMCMKGGYHYTGPFGSGHFTKMVHNSIEYGMMEAIGEGFELLEKGPYKNLDLAAISKLWNHGSIVRGLLMEVTQSALERHKGLKGVPAEVADSGEGKWAVEDAIRHNIPFTVNSHALFARFSSRNKSSTSNKIIAAMRDEFGGHGFSRSNAKKKR